MLSLVYLLHLTEIRRNGQGAAVEAINYDAFATRMVPENALRLFPTYLDSSNCKLKGIFISEVVIKLKFIIKRAR